MPHQKFWASRRPSRGVWIICTTLVSVGVRGGVLAGRVVLWRPGAASRCGPGSRHGLLPVSCRVRSCERVPRVGGRYFPGRRRRGGGGEVAAPRGVARRRGRGPRLQGGGLRARSRPTRRLPGSASACGSALSTLAVAAGRAPVVSPKRDLKRNFICVENPRADAASLRAEHRRHMRPAEHVRNGDTAPSKSY